MARSKTLPMYRHYRVLFEVGSFSGLSDAELLARFVNRQDEAAELAFAALVERHASKVLRICHAVLRNEHDAEDAFQATFLVLATKAAGLRARESLGPWLFAVARRVATGARARAIGREARERRAAVHAAKHPRPDATGDDVSSVLYEEIDRLPERYRLPVVLCDLESQSHQEAARRLGWPLGTVKSRQARGRQRLRARLTRRGLAGNLGLLPAAFAARSARALVPASLIESTARIATTFVSSGTAARVVSASVSTLVTNTLRAMIMIRLSMWMGVLLTVSVGVAATVLAQATPKQAGPSTNSASVSFTQTPASAPSPAPVFEYEIRIWKDGSPVTPMMKMRAVPGETTQLKLPEGTVDLRFQSRTDPFKSVVVSENPPNKPAGVLLSRRAAAERESLKSAADLKNQAEQIDRFKRLREIERAETDARAKQLAEVAAKQAQDQSGSEKKDHDQRLSEIERKLERILSVLDRSPATGKDPDKPSRPR